MSAPLLQLDGVSKSFWRGPRETRVLRELSLTVDAGEFVGVYGTRGVGKTTLLRVAAGFDLPNSGVVSFCGRDVRQLSQDGRTRLHRDQIAWVERSGPQSAELTICDYVALPLYRVVGPSAAQRQALSELGRVGVGDVADQRWADLSDTARMLVALAQALVRRPRLLLADDPTAGLNVIDRERIIGLLRSWSVDGRPRLPRTQPRAHRPGAQPGAPVAAHRPIAGRHGNGRRVPVRRTFGLTCWNCASWSSTTDRATMSCARLTVSRCQSVAAKWLRSTAPAARARPRC
jgi:ABC-type lipoprotein export system ATPase subunit